MLHMQRLGYLAAFNLRLCVTMLRSLVTTADRRSMLLAAQCPQHHLHPISTAYSMSPALSRRLVLDDLVLYAGVVDLGY